jgi:hypothetical protein
LKNYSKEAKIKFVEETNNRLLSLVGALYGLTHYEELLLSIPKRIAFGISKVKETFTELVIKPPDSR